MDTKERRTPQPTRDDLTRPETLACHATFVISSIAFPMRSTSLFGQAVVLGDENVRPRKRLLPSPWPGKGPFYPPAPKETRG
jgi:hypothetical protein